MLGLRQAPRRGGPAHGLRLRPAVAGALSRQTTGPRGASSAGLGAGHVALPKLPPARARRVPGDARRGGHAAPRRPADRGAHRSPQHLGQGRGDQSHGKLQGAGALGRHNPRRPGRGSALHPADGRQCRRRGVGLWRARRCSGPGLRAPDHASRDPGADPYPRRRSPPPRRPHRRLRQGEPRLRGGERRVRPLHPAGALPDRGEEDARPRAR